MQNVKTHPPSTDALNLGHMTHNLLSYSALHYHARLNHSFGAIGWNIEYLYRCKANWMRCPGTCCGWVNLDSMSTGTGQSGHSLLQAIWIYMEITVRCVISITSPVSVHVQSSWQLTSTLSPLLMWNNPNVMVRVRHFCHSRLELLTK